VSAEPLVLGEQALKPNAVAAAAPALSVRKSRRFKLLSIKDMLARPPPLFDCDLESRLLIPPGHILKAGLLKLKCL
jgi:hypothetical protein